MTEGFPLDRDSAEIGVAWHSQMPSAPPPSPAFDYVDDYNLNDIGLAMRLHARAAA
jgi:hypothetical protein